jgi:hypothetical protein
MARTTPGMNGLAGGAAFISMLLLIIVIPFYNDIPLFGKFVIMILAIWIFIGSIQMIRKAWSGKDYCGECGRPYTR